MGEPLGLSAVEHSGESVEWHLISRSLQANGRTRHPGNHKNGAIAWVSGHELCSEADLGWSPHLSLPSLCDLGQLANLFVFH